MTYRQLNYLFKRELQTARRTRGIMMMVILMPIIMWGFQIILPLLRLGIAEGGSASIDVQLDETILIDLGMPLMIAIIVASITIIPFVSASFAGEIQNKTMESLLSLPISRHKILQAKFLAGAVLGLISVVINLVCFILYLDITNSIIAPANGWNSIVFSINVPVSLIPALTLTLFLCTLLNLGIGISVASLAKSAETSRQLFSFLMFPLLFFLTINLFTGIPEVMSGTWNSSLPLLLYLIPWEHALAIFQKAMLPNYFSTNDYLLLGNVWFDVIFHMINIFFVIVIVLWLASKLFDREGLLS